MGLQRKKKTQLKISFIMIYEKNETNIAYYLSIVTLYLNEIISSQLIAKILSFILEIESHSVHIS